MSEVVNGSSSGANPPTKSGDQRLYVLDGDWSAVVHQSAAAQYCYSQNAGEEFYHLILDGEIYLTNGDVKYCLNCAFRHEIVTTDRLFWQHRARKRPARL